MYSLHKPIIVRCGGVYVEEIFPPQVDDQFCVKEVRRIANRIPNIREIGINEVSKVISFQAVDSGWRTNVYYTTGTVGTCVDHPISGKTQLFRRKVDYETLQHIFQNPRVHTSKGYYTTPNIGVKRSAAELSCLEEDEETVLSNQIAILKPQLELMEAQLASIRQKRAEEEQQRVREEQELTRQKEAARLAEEERLRAAAAAAEQERLDRISRQEAKERHAASNRANSLRGACFDYWLSYSDYFPSSMKDVKCVAISNGGYIAVDDNGSCSWHGIPSEVVGVLERQHNRMIDYIALGPNQYYIRKTNGKVLFRGCAEFEEEIRNENGAVKFVTFGDENTYYIEYKDGQTSYNYSFEEQIPSEVLDKLTSRAVRSFYIGQNTPSWSDSAYDKAYCITYEDGSCEYDNLPRHLDDWFEDEKKPGNKVKQVLADTTGCYFVRYT